MNQPVESDFGSKAFITANEVCRDYRWVAPAKHVCEVVAIADAHSGPVDLTDQKFF